MISITEEYSDILLDMSKKACDMRVELYDILKEDEDWSHIKKQLKNAQEILGNLAVLISHKNSAIDSKMNTVAKTKSCNRLSPN